MLEKEICAMSYDYSENILVQESAGHLLEDELGWRVELAYNTEVLGETGTSISNDLPSCATPANTKSPFIASESLNPVSVR